MFESSELLWLALIVLTYMHWSGSQQVKEIALRATKAYCAKMDVQMLDDCIVLHRLWFKRDSGGTIRVWRSYLFEFASTGEQRYKGRIITLGRRILSVEMEPHRV